MESPPDTATRILDAAKKLFAERGYAATTTRSIAEAAGVNEVTLFRRFSSKAGILNALGERIAARQAGHATVMLPVSTNARDTLRKLARMEIETAHEDGGLAIRLAFDARSVPEVAEVLGDAMTKNLENLARYVAERQAAGELRSDIDPRIVAQAFFSLTSSYVMYRMVVGAGDTAEDSTDESSIEQLFELFWSGVART